MQQHLKPAGTTTTTCMHAEARVLPHVMVGAATGSTQPRHVLTNNTTPWSRIRTTATPHVVSICTSSHTNQIKCFKPHQANQTNPTSCRQPIFTSIQGLVGLEVAQPRPHSLYTEAGAPRCCRRHPDPQGSGAMAAQLEIQLQCSFLASCIHSGVHCIGCGQRQLVGTCLLNDAPKHTCLQYRRRARLGLSAMCRPA